TVCGPRISPTPFRAHTAQSLCRAVISPPAMRHSRPAKQTAPASDDNARRGSRGKKKSESPLTPCPCKPLLLYFSHRALLLLLCFKECLLGFLAVGGHPLLSLSGAAHAILG